MEAGEDHKPATPPRKRKFKRRGKTSTMNVSKIGLRAAKGEAQPEVHPHHPAAARGINEPPAPQPDGVVANFSRTRGMNMFIPFTSPAAAAEALAREFRSAVRLGYIEADFVSAFAGEVIGALEREPVGAPRRQSA
jgi:hypothetical protein